ncbi:MAG: FtsQ-type POTRA domain-containing protein [Kineosporiaceae bacterium]
MVLLAVAAVAFACWVLFASAWLRVTHVRVEGAVRLDPGVARQAASSQVGRPMLLAEPAVVADALRGEVVVRDVEVHRRWPTTLTISIRERVPVAAVRRGGGVALVDGEGVVLGQEASVPAGVPTVEVDLARASAPTVPAVVDVLGSLPPWLSEQVRRSGASSPDGVWLGLSSGARVLWGAPDHAELKSLVLRRMMGAPAALYDVSAPGAPAASGSRARPTPRASGRDQGKRSVSPARTPKPGGSTKAGGTPGVSKPTATKGGLASAQPRSSRAAVGGSAAPSSTQRRP